MSDANTVDAGAPLDLELVMEAGCATAVLWGCELSLAQAEQLADSLVSAGRKERSALGATRRFEISEHLILIVMTTGRVQIRLSLGVDRAQRYALARSLWADIQTTYEAHRSP